jgi:hypothetical protein
LYTKTDQFTKTGSGQTQGKALKQERYAFSHSANLTLDFAGGSLFFEYIAGSETAAVGFAAKTDSATEAIMAADAAFATAAANKAAVVASTADPQQQQHQQQQQQLSPVAAAPAANLTAYMPGYDLGGHDMPASSYPAGGVPGGAAGCQHYPKATDPKVCEALCKAAKGCGAWTYVVRGSPAGSGDCCLKHDGMQTCPKALATCTSGVLAPTTKCEKAGHGGGGGKKGKGMNDEVSMLASDTHISIRLFLDTAVAEVSRLRRLCIK